MNELPTTEQRASRKQLYEHADGLLINAGLLNDSRARQLRNAAYALKAAADELDKLRPAVEFYADAQNYVRKDHYSSPSQDFPAWTEPSTVMKDTGSKAREALYGGR